MMKFLEHRIADQRILRIIERILKAGTVEDGCRFKTVVGTPQGAVISPSLGNIYLHYVLDLWAHHWRKTKARGEVYLVRYADDTVTGFQYQQDGKRFQRELSERLKKFGLRLNKHKTRLIEFGRFAQSNRQQRGQGKPKTFDFLGFTHICSRTKTGQHFTVKRKSIASRLRNKLKQIKRTLMINRHRYVVEIGQWLRRVVQGYFNYHGIPGNRRALEEFRTQINRYWLKSLRRRSHKAQKLNWLVFQRLVKRFIPSVSIVHPYPSQRFPV